MNHIAFAAFVIFSAVVIVILFIKIKRLNLKSIRLGESSETFKTALNELYTVQHEFRNHLSVIGALPRVCTDYNELSEKVSAYVTKLGIRTGNTDTFSFLGIANRYLAAFLSGKVSDAKEKGLQFNIEIENNCISYNMPDDELVEIIGSLVDNAVCAASGDGIADKTIFAKIYGDKNFSYFELVNCCSKNFNPGLVFEAGYSTKSGENHGFGLYNALRIAEKYGNIEAAAFRNADKTYACFKVIIRKPLIL